MSVVLVAGRRRARAAHALRSVLEQRTSCALEVLLVDASADDAPVAGHDDPRVRVLVVAPGTHIGAARAHAVRAATTSVVAFLEEHTVVLAGWAEALWQAHQGQWTAVGGECHCANPGDGASATLHLLNFWRWAPPARPGPCRLLQGHNTSYKRDALLRCGADLDELMLSEPVLQARLLRDGAMFCCAPEVRFLHFNETTIGAFASAYYHWGRCLGEARARALGWGRVRRALRAAALPAAVPLRVLRLGEHLLRERRDLLGRYFAGLPFMVAAETAGVVGEGLGLVVGRGRSALGLTEFELDVSRGTGGGA
jgi:hypothetical protein